MYLVRRCLVAPSAILGTYSFTREILYVIKSCYRKRSLEVKCGVNDYSSDYCTKLCCDWRTEHTCYDQHWNPASCRKYEEGDCPDEFILGSLNPQVERMNYSDNKQEWNELT